MDEKSKIGLPHPLFLGKQPSFDGDMGKMAVCIASKSNDAADELKQLHARVEELEAMLDAVGADGVSAQRVTQAKWTGALRGEDCKHEVFDDGVKTMIPRNPAFVRITHIPTGVTVECRDDERSPRPSRSTAAPSGRLA